jgi:1-acyl-sn-glycerol-3-phosphate acyltransferase
MREAERAAREERQIVIFPEGTRASPGEMNKLQPGIAAMAARTRLPVIPVLTDSGRYWGRRAFRKRPGTIRIALLEPIPAGTARETLMRDLSTVLAREPEEAVDNSVH